MATLRNKRKLAAIYKENHEDYTRNVQARNTNSPRIQEDYVTQGSKKIEGRVTKKLSQEFSKTESHILGALFRLDEFLLNPHARTHSGPVLETSRNFSGGNQGTNEDGSQNDPHPIVGVSQSQSTQDLSPEETSYKNLASVFRIIPQPAQSIFSKL